jgi:hypothetical protein
MPDVEQNATTPSLSRTTLSEIATSAIRFWEPGRVLYNAVLAAVVIAYFIKYWPASRNAVTFDQILAVIILAVLANACYCAAYIVDIFAQLSDFRPLWLRLRWLLLVIGILFAAILTRFFAIDFFNNPAHNPNAALRPNPAISYSYNPESFRADITKLISARRYAAAVAYVESADAKRQAAYDKTGYVAVGEDMIVLPGVYPRVDYDDSRDWYMPGTQDAIEDMAWQKAATRFAEQFNRIRAGE